MLWGQVGLFSNTSTNYSVKKPIKHPTRGPFGFLNPFSFLELIQFSMEVPEMEGKTESHGTSAVAFVEGGIQEACDDACSICLEDFCESDPAN
ncbi:putative E3 ubiquitin-protein ligase, partial [Sesbania bispinosa]